MANLEALLNIIANGMEIPGIARGEPTIIRAGSPDDALLSIVRSSCLVHEGDSTRVLYEQLAATQNKETLWERVTE